MPSGVNAPTSLIIDAFDSTHFLLSAWGRKTDGKFSPDQGGGIYLSHDEGKTWSNVLVEDQHIHDLSYDPRNKTYYACGFNGSAYRSVDGGRSWTRIKGYNFKWGKEWRLIPMIRIKYSLSHLEVVFGMAPQMESGKRLKISKHQNLPIEREEIKNVFT